MRHLLALIVFFAAQAQLYAHTYQQSHCLSLLSEEQYTMKGEIEAGGATVWNAVTGRTFNDYLDSLTSINARLKGLIPFKRFHPFEVDRILDGTKSVLSIGEGNADFISTIIERRLDNGEALEDIENAFAIDITYPKEPKFNGRYHRLQFIQELNIVDDQGRKILFDEVISSYSLTYVLDKASFQEKLQILKQILNHMKSGGALRAWPILNLLKLRVALATLLTTGLIANISTSEGVLLIERR